MTCEKFCVIVTKFRAASEFELLNLARNTSPTAATQESTSWGQSQKPDDANGLATVDAHATAQTKLAPNTAHAPLISNSAELDAGSSARAFGSTLKLSSNTAEPWTPRDVLIDDYFEGSPLVAGSGESASFGAPSAQDTSLRDSLPVVFKVDNYFLLSFLTSAA